LTNRVLAMIHLSLPTALSLFFLGQGQYSAGECGGTVDC
jgi:hypothetical protein